MPMKPLILAALGCILAPSLASAQPGGPPPPPPPGYYGGGGYYGPPPPPPPMERRGLALGFGFGFGGMNSESGAGDCIDCNYDPIAFGLDFHIGGMLNPRMALLLELQGTWQTLDADGFNYLSQTMMLGALQYWLSPQLWIKGGIGFSGLDVHYDDGYYAEDAHIDSGIGLLGAIGYEVAHSTRFAIDLALRLSTAKYDAVDDTINSAIIGIGFNWY